MKLNVSATSFVPSHNGAEVPKSSITAPVLEVPKSPITAPVPDVPKSPIITPVAEVSISTITKQEKLEKLSLLVEEMVAASEEVHLTREAKKLMAELYYPYDALYRLVPTLFNLYLQNQSIGKEMHEDLCYIIVDCIEDDSQIQGLDWDLFITKLQLRRESIQDLPRGQRELYLNRVVHVGPLIDAASLGFIDHRLEHAIITIQRLIRHGRHTPPPLYQAEIPNAKSTLASKNSEWEAWYQDFEAKHHQRDPSWDEHHLHLNHFDQARNISMDEGETSVLLWNRQLVFQYIIAGLALKQKKYYTGLSVHFDLEQVIGVSLDDIRKGKRDRVVKCINPGTRLTYDYWSKLEIIIRYYFREPPETRRSYLTAWRHEYLDSFKFTLITGPTGDDYAKLEDNVFEELVPYSLADIEAIVARTNKSTAEYGTNLLQRFSTLDLGRLQTSELKQWFLDMTIKSLDDLIKEFGGSNLDDKLITSTLLRQFLCNEISPRVLQLGPRIVSFLRRVLEDYQTKIKKGLSPYPKLLSYYSPIVEMIKLKATIPVPIGTKQ